MISLFDEGAFPPCPAPFNMAAHVLAAGLGCPEKDALLILAPDAVEAWSHARLRAAVLGTATGLLRRGLGPGDRVVLRLGNTVDYPISYLGALAAGMVPVPTSPALTEAETRHILDVLRPAAVLHDAAVACPPCDGAITRTELEAFRALPPSTFDMGDPDRLGYVIFTSGTSGRPQAVAHAHRAIWARQMMFEDWYGLGPDDRLLHAGAFNWTYTMGTGLMDPWAIGATALVPAPGHAPRDLPALLAAHGATILAAAPGVYRQLLSGHERLDLPALRHGLSAGEKLPATLAERWRSATGRPVFEAFGMSECSTFVSQAPGRDDPAGSLGRPQRGRRIALMRDGAPVPLGEEGTIAVHRSDPGLMLGYLDAQGGIAAPLEGEWFLTGDQAVMHDDGSLRYMGRIDDMMNAGGYRVSPIEVETVLCRHPGITAAAAVTVKVKQDTDVIAAFYTGPAPLDEAALRTYVSGELARYKQPRVFIHLSDLPLGANGKILRRVLRDHYERLS
jgi:acyl-coenzyme A synthetase/AMP-(fatty) acid ligase